MMTFELTKVEIRCRMSVDAVHAIPESPRKYAAKGEWIKMRQGNNLNIYISACTYNIECIAY